MSRVDGSANQPTANVIIPVRDDARVVACLRRLLDQTYPRDLIEIVIVDNGSRVPVHGLLSDLLTNASTRIKVLSHAQGGSYEARNVGINESTGEVLAFTDADCLPEPTWLSQAVSALADGIDIVAGRVKVYPRDSRRPHPVETYEMVHSFPQELYTRRGGCVCANMVTSRVLFRKVGEFQNVASGGDIEWGERAHSMGYVVRYVPDTVVYHPARKNFSEFYTKLNRVINGQRDRDLAMGRPDAAKLPSLRHFLPPLGAFRRARQHPDLTTVRSRLALVVGEVWRRYARAWITTRTAIRIRRNL